MPTYKLLAQHYINDRLLEEGELVGEGTNNPLPDGYEPTDQMEVVSAATPEEKAAAEAKVEKVRKRVNGVMNLDQLSNTVDGGKK